MKIKGYQVRVQVRTPKDPTNGADRWMILRRSGGRPLIERRARAWQRAWEALGHVTHVDIVW